MGIRENIETVKRFYAASPADDDSPRVEFFAPDAVWHVPGNNPVSGDYHGVEAITNEISSRMQPLEEWEIEAKHVMGNGDRVVAIVHVKAGRRGQTVRGHGAHAFRFNDEGLIVEAWGFNEDQDAIDELFRA